jgi:hypothetical protein
MRSGELVERGTHVELLERGGFYASLFKSQLRRQRPRVRRVLAVGRRPTRAVVSVTSVTAQRTREPDRLVSSWSRNGR